MTIEMSISLFVLFSLAVSMDWIAASQGKRTTRRCECASYERCSPFTASIRIAGWTWMRILPVCWWATPHQEKDELLRVGHEMRSLIKQHGAAANDTRHCW